MALTPEQQAELDIQVSLNTQRLEKEKQNRIDEENARHANQLQLEVRRTKLESVRLAKEILIENARSKPVDSRDISANDIKSYAQTLVDYVNE